ncbi:hypothetical protein PFISCL1PPCAC_13294, partial [Pristionchus fissidentatus]
LIPPPPRPRPFPLLSYCPVRWFPFPLGRLAVGSAATGGAHPFSSSIAASPIALSIIFSNSSNLLRSSSDPNPSGYLSVL